MDPFFTGSILAALPYPNIGPIAFSIPIPFTEISLDIRWYALSYIAGLVLGWQYILWLLRKDDIWPTSPSGAVQKPATSDDIDDFLIWVTLGVILGGRLGYVFFYQPSILFNDPLGIFAVWTGGMSFHGGLIGVTLAGYIFCQRRKLSFLKMGDLSAAAVPIGIFLVRIANFINGELWGKPSNVSWAMVFPNGGNVTRHPSQLYEALLEGLILFIVLWIATHRFGLLKRPGVLTGLFVAGYGIARIIVEFFREPDGHIGYLTGGFVTMGMVLSLPMVMIGAALIWRSTDNAPAWLKDPFRPKAAK